jgi:hypothetical protein
MSVALVDLAEIKRDTVVKAACLGGSGDDIEQTSREAF